MPSDMMETQLCVCTSPEAPDCTVGSEMVESFFNPKVNSFPPFLRERVYSR